MTAKRFEIIENSKNYLRVDDETKKMFYLNEKEVVDLLNDLSEKNEQLKDALKELKEIGDYQSGRIKELTDENEQLKKILSFLENDNAEDILNVLNSQENKIWELKQENKQLKSDNKEYIKGLNLAKATSQSWASDVRELR